MIDMSVVLNNPDLCQAFTAQRSSGSFVAGRFVSKSTEVPLYGSVQVADPKTLEQVPEADRVTGAIAVYTASPIYETRTGDNEGLSDLILHKGKQYRLAKVWDRSNFGFFKAVGVRVKGS
jgi:hypothetical protein